nr:hypothetical protein [Rhizobium leguminosarum]
MIGDHTTAEVMHTEVRAVLQGGAHELAAPQPFRNLVVQARLGMDAKGMKRSSGRCWPDIDEPTLPFGLSEVYGDGADPAMQGGCCRRRSTTDCATRRRWVASNLPGDALMRFWASMQPRLHHQVADGCGRCKPCGAPCSTARPLGMHHLGRRSDRRSYGLHHQ